MRLYRALPLILMAATCALLSAQGTDLGTVRGQIVDAQGGAVAGAKIKLVDLATGNATEVATDSEGNYQAGNLRPGEYKLTITASGFATVEVGKAIVRGRDRKSTRLNSSHRL